MITARSVEEACLQQQWLLHYQPKVDLASGALTGVEALLRWNLEFLREIECDVAQGFFIGRPMDVASLPAWLENWQGRRRQLFAA